MLIGEKKCTITSCSDEHITCNAPNAYKKYEIIASRVDSNFKWSTPNLTINRGDFIEWRWSPLHNRTNTVFKVEQVEHAESTERIGFSSGDPSSNGEKILIYTTA